MVEVCYRPWNFEVHGAELFYQALQILPTNAALRRRDGGQLVQLLEFPLGEGYHTGLCVDCPPKDFLHTGTVSLPHLEILQAH